MSVATLSIPQSEKRIQLIPMDQIYSDEEFNCRGNIIPLNVIDLAQSIKEKGLISPIVVQPYSKGPPGTRYRIISGHRRYMAHRVNRADQIEAVIREGLSEIDAKVFNLAENLNRADLTYLQEAKAVHALELQGLTQKEIAERLGKGILWVQHRVWALRLDPVVQEEIEAGWIKGEHIAALHRMQPQEQLEEVKKIKEIKQREGFRTRVKINKKTKRTSDKFRRVRRQPADISKMLDHILDTIGGNFGTRCLAWAAGNISSYDLYIDIEEQAADKGVSYEPPEEDICA